MAKSSELRRLEERRETIKMSLRTLRSDMSNPARLKKQVEDDHSEIKHLLLRIEQNKARLDSMDLDHDNYVTELALVNKSMRMEVHDVKIRALKKMASAIGYSGDTIDA